jgi:hypothetical protein
MLLVLLHELDYYQLQEMFLQMLDEVHDILVLLIQMEYHVS